jgi:hypothetical protein
MEKTAQSEAKRAGLTIRVEGMVRSGRVIMKRIAPGLLAATLIILTSPIVVAAGDDAVERTTAHRYVLEVDGMT